MLAISTYAERTRDVALKLAQAHELGIPSGDCREPWTLAYLRPSLPILAKTLPRPYLERIGAASLTCATAMRRRGVSESVRGDWVLIIEQYEAVGVAFGEYLGSAVVPHAGSLEPVSPVSPGVMRYDELAGLVHPDGVARLLAAGVAVENYCLRSALGGITNEEVEWLRSMARGERTIDIANAQGYSERAFYRALSRLWGKLGVAGRVQALALAAEQGWLDDVLVG